MLVSQPSQPPQRVAHEVIAYAAVDAAVVSDIPNMTVRELLTICTSLAQFVIPHASKLNEV
jgi:hypothetical protein